MLNLKKRQNIKKKSPNNDSEEEDVKQVWIKYIKFII